MIWLGPSQPEALKLYASCGHERRGPFGKYPNGALSVFMQTRIEKVDVDQKGAFRRLVEGDSPLFLLCRAMRAWRIHALHLRPLGADRHHLGPHDGRRQQHHRHRQQQHGRHA